MRGIMFFEKIPHDCYACDISYSDELDDLICAKENMEVTGYGSKRPTWCPIKNFYGFKPKPVSFHDDEHWDNPGLHLND